MTSFTDTMISAKNYEDLVQFYTQFASFELIDKNDNFAILKNMSTQQVLCVTDGNSVSQPSPGFKTENLDTALEKLINLGGKIKKTWDFGTMKGANCEDIEGNEIMVWQGNH